MVTGRWSVVCRLWFLQEPLAVHESTNGIATIRGRLIPLFRWSVVRGLWSLFHHTPEELALNGY